MHERVLIVNALLVVVLMKCVTDSLASGSYCRKCWKLGPSKKKRVNVHRRFVADANFGRQKAQEYFLVGRRIAVAVVAAAAEVAVVEAEQLDADASDPD